MLLMIDNYDSFVYNLVRYIDELNEKVEVIRNDQIHIDEVDIDKYSGIIISPGPKSPKEAGLCLKVIDKFKGKIPILGVCLGHQCIGHYFNGSIIKGERPYHGKISEVIHSDEGIFKNIKNPLNVTRYHSLVIDRESLPEELKVTCETKDNVIMGIEHKHLPIYGVQFHPEAVMTEQGHELLKNFIDICGEFKNDRL